MIVIRHELMYPPFEIGSIQHGPLSDENSVYHIVAFKVIKEATKQEFINFILTYNIPPNEVEMDNHRFYWVQMD